MIKKEERTPVHKLMFVLHNQAAAVIPHWSRPRQHSSDCHTQHRQRPERPEDRVVTNYKELVVATSISGRRLSARVRMMEMPQHL